MHPLVPLVMDELTDLIGVNLRWIIRLHKLESENAAVVTLTFVFGPTCQLHLWSGIIILIDHSVRCGWTAWMTTSWTTVFFTWEIHLCWSVHNGWTATACVQLEIPAGIDARQCSWINSLLSSLLSGKAFWLSLKKMYFHIFQKVQNISKKNVCTCIFISLLLTNSSKKGTFCGLCEKDKIRYYNKPFVRLIIFLHRLGKMSVWAHRLQRYTCESFSKYFKFFGLELSENPNNSL
jgi:hypothetical protein